MPWLLESFRIKGVLDNKYKPRNDIETLNNDEDTCHVKITDNFFEDNKIERTHRSEDQEEDNHADPRMISEKKVSFDSDSPMKHEDSQANSGFLEKVKLLKKKLNIIDDYKVNTEVYEKSRYLIDVDSLEVQTRELPGNTEENKRKIDENHFQFQPESALIIRKNQIQDGKHEREVEVGQAHIYATEVSQAYANIGHANQDHTVTVVIENTKTPTRAESNFIRNVLSESKFEPDSIDGHRYDSLNTGSNIKVTNETSIVTVNNTKLNDNLNQAQNDLTVKNINISSTGIEESTEVNDIFSKEGETSIDPNDDSHYSCIQDNESSTASSFNSQETKNTDDNQTTAINNNHNLAITTPHQPVNKTSETNVNFVKFKAKSFLKKKKSMKENEIIQVLTEVKENECDVKKQNKTSYDLSIPDSSGVSSSHSLIASSTPGRENWKLRESECSKCSSTTCK